MMKCWRTLFASSPLTSGKGHVRGSIYGAVHVFRVQISPLFNCAVPHLMGLLLREARAIIIEE